MIFLRSSIFNLIFFLSSLILSLILLPGAFLPRKSVLKIVHLWTGVVAFLEKHILGLTYEIRGQEHLPKEGSYIVAAKHQSAYETMKLHALFNDPSIVLKKELTDIPFWGLFLKKVDVIAINRENREEAMRSIIDGAKRIKEQARPIVIFPQGTRVSVENTPKEKPYKAGILKMYNATNLPIIPMALNTGVFWPKNSFLKYPGTVIFEFLPPIPAGESKEDVKMRIEEALEENSNRLMNESVNTNPALAYAKKKLLPLS